MSSGARCEVCRRTCSSSDILAGMRCEWCGITVSVCVFSFFYIEIHLTHTCLVIQRFQFACCRLDSSHKRLHYLVIGRLLGCHVLQWINLLFNRCNIGCSSCQHSQNCTRLKLNTDIACCVFYSFVILAVDIFSIAWPGFLVSMYCR